MAKYFGTDGFRGEANIDVTAEHAMKIGRFIGWYYGREHRSKIVIGKDTRRSGYLLESALTAGLTASGADVYLMHVTTTPSVAYVACGSDFDCGIMISASHNPYSDNGIKLLNGCGEKMEDSVIEALEEYLDAEKDTLPRAAGAELGRVIDFSSGRDAYVDHLASLSRSLRGLRVGIDCANGSVWQLAERVFASLRAETYVINNTPNGININDNCGSTHIEGLRAFVRENKLDVGFALDGDADRCLAVDENGEVVDGDGIIYIYGRYLKELGRLKNNTVVTTVMSNFGLYKAFDEMGVHCEKTAVGDKYVFENMKLNGHILGGEQSGHVIFGEYANTGDGLLTAIQLLQVMLESGKKLSELAAPVTFYPQVLKNVEVTDKDLTLADPSVCAAVHNAEEKLGGEGRVLLRKSGTEPVLRVMSEAKSFALCEEQVDAIIDAMRNGGYLIRVK